MTTRFKLDPELAAITVMIPKLDLQDKEVPMKELIGRLTAASLHHSTVHAKLPDLARTSGYDPLTPLGRTRLSTALLLQHIAPDRIDSSIRS